VANDPGEAAAHALAGAAALRAGWRARTNERAEHVQTEQFKTFWSWLDRAESYLRSAAELDPADPTPLVYLLASARGLQHPREDVTSVFTELRRRDPGHLEGHRQMMQYVCEKWFGSHDEMFAFARGVSDQSPQGSPLHELPIFAHVERWADLSTDKPDEAKQRRDYFKATSVLAEIEQAKQRLGPLLTAPVDGSSVTVRNMLVVVAFGQDDRDGFVQAVSDVQGLVSPMPWNYFGADPVRVLQATWRSLSK
jgi:hypothetical protein